MQDINIKVEQRLQDKQKGREFQDFGRVADSRKERAAYTIFTSADLSEVENNPVLAYKLVQKDKIWQPYDMKEQQAKGVTPGAAFLKMKLRELLPSKTLDNPEARKVYIYLLEYIKDGLEEAKTIDAVFSVVDAFRYGSDFEKIIIPKIVAEKNIDIAKAILELAEIIKKKKKRFMIGYTDILKEILGTAFINLAGNGRGSDAARATLATAISYNAVSQEEADTQKEKYIETVKKSREYHYEKAKERLDNFIALSNKEKYNFIKQRFQINQSQSNFDASYWETALKNDLDKKYNSLNELISIPDKYIAKEADWSWAFEKKTVKKNTKTEWTLNKKPPLAYIIRKNGYVVPDEISVQMLVSDFGFKSLNFGHYVSDKEAKAHVKRTYEALTDMGDILNINIAQLNKLGGLGLGIGLKGTSGALATYYGQTKDINLTKKNGDGSLAHEWGHYLDNTMAELDVKRGVPSFSTVVGALHPKTSLSVKKIISFIKNGKAPELLYSAENYSVEVIAVEQDSFPSEMGGYNRTIKIQDSFEATLEKYKDFLDLSKSSLNLSLNAIGFMLHKHNIEKKIIEFKINSSRYYLDSLALQKDNDRKQGGTSYWISEVELFARAWERYIELKLENKGQKNTYLVTTYLPTLHYPYPIDREAEILEIYFDEMLANLKIEYSVNDFIPKTTQRMTEQIIEFDNLPKGEILEDGVIAVEKNNDVADSEAVAIDLNVENTENIPSGEDAEKDTTITENEKVDAENMPLVADIEDTSSSDNSDTKFLKGEIDSADLNKKAEKEANYPNPIPIKRERIVRFDVTSTNITEYGVYYNNKAYIKQYGTEDVVIIENNTIDSYEILAPTTVRYGQLTHLATKWIAMGEEWLKEQEKNKANIEQKDQEQQNFLKSLKSEGYQFVYEAVSTIKEGDILEIGEVSDNNLINKTVAKVVNTYKWGDFENDYEVTMLYISGAKPENEDDTDLTFFLPNHFVFKLHNSQNIDNHSKIKNVYLPLLRQVMSKENTFDISKEDLPKEINFVEAFTVEHLNRPIQFNVIAKCFIKADGDNVLNNRGVIPVFYVLQAGDTTVGVDFGVVQGRYCMTINVINVDKAKKYLESLFGKGAIKSNAHVNLQVKQALTEPILKNIEEKVKALALTNQEKHNAIVAKMPVRYYAHHDFYMGDYTHTVTNEIYIEREGLPYEGSKRRVLTYNVIGEKAMEAFKPFVTTENYWDDKTTEISKTDFDAIAKLIEEHQGVLRTIEAEKKAKKEEQKAQEHKRITDIFAKAKETGQKQELSSYFITGDDIPKHFRDDDSDMGHMVTWAMPDGTTKTEFIHSY